jgi:HD-GYP domain-containing protein (c-di-GMP phosphodiesterase class II)
VGEQIPQSARIVSVADVYDALTSVRPYKGAWPHEQAVDEITRLSGCHFDPKVVNAFLESVQE